MYKTIELKMIIGCICLCYSKQYENLTIDDILSIAKRIKAKDSFINIILSKEGIMDIEDILGHKISDTTNLLPCSEQQCNAFIREYYKADKKTRDIIYDNCMIF